VGGYRAVKAVFRASFKTDDPYEREFRGIQRFEPISRSHDGFVDVLQVGRDDADGYFYYVMELADAFAPEADQQSNLEAHLPQSEAPAPPIGFAGYVPDPDAYVPRTLREDVRHRGRLPVEECIQLALNLSLALAHLHRQGLIHRDLKPSNIIFVRGIPKLADIGLVTDLSEAHSFVGTEGFIPPEGPNTPQADIYSLGKVLYEISMGKDRKDFPEPATLLGEGQESQRLEELNAVILKACASNPADRYQTAEEMSADLAFLQSGRSVRNRRPLEKRVAFLTRLAAMVAIGAVIALGAYAFQRSQTAEQRRLAQENRRLAGQETQQRARAEQALQDLEFQRAHEQFQSGNSGVALAYLANVLRRDPSNRIAAERLVSALTLRNFALPRYELPHNGQAVSATFNRNGERILTASRDGKARIEQAATGQRLSELDHGNELAEARFSQDSRWVLTRATNGTVRVWTAASGEQVFPVLVAPPPTVAMFSADGEKILIGGSDGLLQIRSTITGEMLAGPLEHDQPLEHASLSPDGTRIITSANGKVRIWDLANNKVLAEATGPGFPQDRLEISPDGRRWFAWTTGLAGQVWDAHTGKPVSAELPHKFPVQTGRFSPDGRRVVTASNDQTAQIWDAETGSPSGRPLQHGNGVLDALFSANGEKVVTLARDQYIRRWDAAS
jgi:WD40 repeat protein